MTNPPDDLNSKIDAALALHQGQNFDAAEDAYRTLIGEHPDNPELHQYLGLVLHQKGENENALDHLGRAVELSPDAVQFRTNLGIVEIAAGRTTAAIETFSVLIEQGHGTPDILNARAMAYKSDHQIDRARDDLNAILKDHPTHAGAYFNLGNLELEHGHTSSAVDCFVRALELSPNDPPIIRNLAAAWQIVGETEKAEGLLEDLIERHPSDAAALNNLGNLKRQSGELAEAHNLFERAIAIDPTLADAHYNLGALLATKNDIEKARTHFIKAKSLRPDFVKADWAAALSLPQIYASEDAILEHRARWLSGLADLTDRPVPAEGDALSSEFSVISEMTPFALAYQGEDDLGAMTLWGDRVSALTGNLFPKFAELPKRPERARKCIAFVSAHFRSHTIEQLFSAWVTALDRNQFEVHLISTAGAGDARTKALTNSVDGAYTGAASTPEIAEHLYELAPDVIIYPDIGMDPRTQVLASLRLAPHQAMAWGHPVTSGLPTVDTFLSSELMEPENRQRAYRENLVTLPNLSIAYERPSTPEGDIPSHDFLCAQSLFKVLPRQDRCFADILRACPGAKLSFFAHSIPEITAAFHQRLMAAGLCEDQMTFIPPCDRNTFMKHMAGSRVVLDTLEWSGGNTSLEAFAMGTPVITVPGRFMRGRHTSAMLDLMDASDLKCADVETYTETAIRLFAQKSELDYVREAIHERAHRLFDDQKPLGALNDYLRSL